MNARRPNKSLQRTRAARAPLSRKPFGGFSASRSQLSSAVVAASLTLLSDWAGQSRRPVPQYDKALTLSIKPASREVKIGAQVPTRYVLRNISVTTQVGCLTDRRGYTLWGTADLKQRVGVVDHNYCQKPLRLAPGKQLEWSEEVEVLDVGAGEAKLSAWVQVADPRTCDQYGCDGNYIRSNPEILRVVGR